MSFTQNISRKSIFHNLHFSNNHKIFTKEFGILTENTIHLDK